MNTSLMEEAIENLEVGVPRRVFFFFLRVCVCVYVCVCAFFVLSMLYVWEEVEAKVYM